MTDDKVLSNNHHLDPADVSAAVDRSRFVLDVLPTKTAIASRERRTQAASDSMWRTLLGKTTWFIKSMVKRILLYIYRVSPKMPWLFSILYTGMSILLVPLTRKKVESLEHSLGVLTEQNRDLALEVQRMKVLIASMEKGLPHTHSSSGDMSETN